MARALAVLAASLLAAATAAWAQPPAFVDAVLAQVAGRVLTASDVALARALALFGLVPAATPLDAALVERAADALRVVDEAERLEIGGDEAEVAAAWAAAAARVGGPDALRRWLAAIAMEEARARALVAQDARHRRFVEVRFREFVFVTPAEVAAALGPGEHPPAEEEAARERLREAHTQERLRAWLAERRQAAPTRRTPAADAGVPDPFPVPPRPAQ
jgi:hypothetical protein